MAEIRRSLQTADPVEARRRCLAATVWFKGEMERLRKMTTPTRVDLEAAAVRYFQQIADEQDKPRNFDDDNFDRHVDYEVSQAEAGISLIDVQLVRNDFSGDIELSASALTEIVGVELDQLPDDLKLAAISLAARAIREASRLYIHKLKTPAKRFETYDELFAQREMIGLPARGYGSAPPRTSPSLRAAADEYIEKTRARGVGQTHITELERAIGWLCQVVGPGIPVGAITTDVMKRFRDDLQRLDRRFQGRDVPFLSRLTNDAQHQVVYVTANRYWQSIMGFFAWCKDEKLIGENPADIAKMPRPKGQQRKSPEPFTAQELRKIMQAPLYAGYRSPKQVLVAGDCAVRGGHWWLIVLLMHTGLRAGELSQLLPSDFAFDHSIPHLKIRTTDDEGSAVKSVKTSASVRDVPLHPNLLILGLREFVEGRAKYNPKGRVFQEFRLGTKGRKSEGATRFGGDFLKKAGVWKEGRSTHVWRHTVTEFLRLNGLSDENIGALIGHSARTMTASYGNKQHPLPRKKSTLDKLDFGFDVVGCLGGPYDPKRHRA
jgi:integrase